MIAQKNQDVTACADECMSTVGEYINRGAEQFSHMVQDRPTRSLLVTCAAGFGLGLVISRLLTHQEPKHSYGAFDRGTAERFGRNLLEKVEHALPAMLRDRLTK
ncbi:MAG: hypothetical protein SH868_05305 [Bythopirellula sp.]|nr:hypothetical protein [Bythopirellula sp.]